MFKVAAQHQMSKLQEIIVASATGCIWYGGTEGALGEVFIVNADLNGQPQVNYQSPVEQNEPCRF